MWNSYGTGAPQLSEKWTFLSLAFYNAPSLHTVNRFQARKKSTKINFLGLEIAGWGGGLPREGVGVEKFVPSLESLSSLSFEERNLGCPGNLAGMS